MLVSSSTPGDLVERLRLRSVFPEWISGRLTSYERYWSDEKRRYCESRTNEPLTFDFAASYPYDVLLHHQAGGGELGLFALTRLRVRPEIILELERRIRAIGGPYHAIHVRHTDYRSDYGTALARLRAQLPPGRPLFLATDNRAVVDAFRAALGHERVHAFSRLPDAIDVPTYREKLAGEAVWQRNRDALLDLLMLALSVNLEVLQVRNNPYGRYSGFSILARHLWSSKLVLRHLLGRRSLDFR